MRAGPGVYPRVRQGQEGKSVFGICVTPIHGCTRCLQVLQHMAGVRYEEILLVPRIERFLAQY